MNDGPTPSESTTGITVVVPTRNSSRTIEGCLRSLREQTRECTIVVVDNRSSDGTEEIARPLADLVLTRGPERSAQRNLGVQARRAPIVGFIDSDMYVGRTVVADAAARLDAGVDAIIVPERTVGVGYWSSVRAFERSFYYGHDSVEAARFFRSEVFEALGGFDEGLTGPEDWDLTIRVREIGSIERIDGWIDHDEGHVRYIDACRKKAYYAEGLHQFVEKHGVRALAKAGNRSYVWNPTQLVNRAGIGLVALKMGEAVAVSATLLQHHSARK